MRILFKFVHFVENFELIWKLFFCQKTQFHALYILNVKKQFMQSSAYFCSGSFKQFPFQSHFRFQIPELFNTQFRMKRIAD